MAKYALRQIGICTFIDERDGSTHFWTPSMNQADFLRNVNESYHIRHDADSVRSKIGWFLFAYYLFPIALFFTHQYQQKRLWCIALGGAAGIMGVFFSFAARPIFFFLSIPGILLTVMGL